MRAFYERTQYFVSIIIRNFYLLSHAEQNNLKYNDDVGDLSPVHRSSSICYYEGCRFHAPPTHGIYCSILLRWMRIGWVGVCVS